MAIWRPQQNSDYLYRYTVFTPRRDESDFQRAENRLDTLRKIFNIDKYKTSEKTHRLELKTENKLLNERVSDWRTQQNRKQLENEINEIKKQQEELNVNHEELRSVL